MAGKKGMKRRTNADIAAVRKAAREELAAHYPMTLQQVHYRLVSRADIVQPNPQSAYDKLSEWLRDDRLAGYVPWEWMEDRLRVEQDWPMWDNPKEFLLRRASSMHAISSRTRRITLRCGARRMRCLGCSRLPSSRSA